jgi:hypothetical protein
MIIIREERIMGKETDPEDVIGAVLDPQETHWSFDDTWQIHGM